MRLHTIAMTLSALLATSTLAQGTEVATPDDTNATTQTVESTPTLADPKVGRDHKSEALINQARVESPDQSPLTTDPDLTVPTPEPAVNETPKDPEVSAVLALIEQSSSDDAPVALRKDLFDYYNANVTSLIWISKTGALTERAHNLIKELKAADDWGLESAQFKLGPAVTNLQDAPTQPAASTHDQLAQAEVALSLAALKYALHARGGRISKPTELLSSYLDREPTPLETTVTLNALRDPGQQPDTYLRSLHPKHEQFTKLREALLELRSGATKEPKPEDIKLPTSGRMLRNGISHPDVALLRKRLEVPASTANTTATFDSASANDGDAITSPPEHTFDDELEAAVKNFQTANDLSADGIVGNGTRRALNAGATETVTENVLIANMEAWRWMPQDLGTAHVTVNIPEFMMRFVKNGEVQHEERAIIGKTNNQTPVFSDEMETVVFHPFWGVPNSIKVKELWPSLARGGNILRRQGLRIQRNGKDVNPDYIDWSYADIRKYHVYQPPGRTNVLGVVKFLFPNKHQVYLHDTPTKHLFKKNVRTYSHGCMRIRNPLKLAEIVLQNDKSWTDDQVQDLVKNGPKNNQIKLE